MSVVHDVYSTQLQTMMIGLVCTAFISPVYKRDIYKLTSINR